MLLKKSTIIIVLLLGLHLSCKADTIDNYQLYIKGKLLLNNSGYGSASKERLILSIASSQENDSIILFYHHCTTGSGKRKARLVNASGEAIKQWSFADEAQSSGMPIPVADLSAFKNIKELSLYYDDDRSGAGIFICFVQVE
ncbi:MAG: hypothetical protein QM687_10275 [Ferruginibacter sp.]